MAFSSRPMPRALSNLIREILPALSITMLRTTVPLILGVASLLGKLGLRGVCGPGRKNDAFLIAIRRALERCRQGGETHALKREKSDRQECCRRRDGTQAWHAQRHPPSRKKTRSRTACASSRELSGWSRWISICWDLLKRTRTGLAMLFLVDECGTRTLQPQSVRREA